MAKRRTLPPPPEQNQQPDQGLIDQGLKVYLVVVCSDKARSLNLGRRFEIRSKSLKLGNGNDADIPVGIGWTEPCAVQIFFKGTTWFVQNLTNSGHLSVNGVPVQKIQISDGDLIQVGEFAFELSSSHGIKFDFFEDTEKARQEDILTKAYNKVYLKSVLQWEINRYNQEAHRQKQDTVTRRTKRPLIPLSPMSLIMFDINHFGKFNKLHDHQVGDEVLKGVVDRVKSRVRNTDVVARFGGDEFYVYLPNTAKEEAVKAAEELRKQVGNTPFDIDDKEEKKSLSVTISLGVAEYETGMDVDAFMKTANKKMLMAKKQGRNRVVS